MSLESDLFTLLKTVCPRVYPDQAPADVALPYMVWTIMGGDAIRPLNKTVPNRRSAIVQVSIWSVSRLEASTLILATDSAMRQATAFDAQAESEMVSISDPDTGYRGATQDFMVRGYR